MSIQTAFLLSLLVTAGFETVDARRLNRDKTKQFKRELDIDGAGTYPRAMRLNPAHLKQFKLELKRELRGDEGVNDEQKLQKDPMAAQEKGIFTISTEAVSAGSQYQMKVKSIDKNHFDVGDVVRITSMLDEDKREEVAVIVEMELSKNPADIYFTSKLKFTHTEGAVVEPQSHDANTMNMLLDGCMDLARQLKVINEQSSSEERGNAGRFNQLIKGGSDRLFRMAFKIQLLSKKNIDQDKLKNTVDEAYAVLDVLGYSEDAMNKMKELPVKDVLYIAKGMPLPLEARVAVVGAGPSGLHMAAMLTKKGYDQITIFEKTDRVGGKSYTLYMYQNGTQCSQRPLNLDGTTDWSKAVDRACRPVEQGTCFLHNGYHFVRNLNAEYGLTGEAPPAEGKMTAIDRHESQCIMAESLFPDDRTPENTPEAKPFSKYMSRLLEQEYKDIKLDIGGFRKALKFLNNMREYNQMHSDLLQFEHPAHTFPKRPEGKVLEELALPFEEFLRGRGLAGLIGVLNIAQAAQGYGYLKEIPAYYGLVWITPQFMCGAAQTLLMQILGTNRGDTAVEKFLADRVSDFFHFSESLANATKFRHSKCLWSEEVVELTTMLPEGYNAIWKKMYERDLKGKVKFLVDELEIHRDPKLDNPVHITYSVPSESDPITQEFDFLIYSGNVRTATNYIKDLTAFEETLFQEHWTGATLVANTYRSPPIPSFTDESSNYGLMYNADNIAGPEKNGFWYSDNSGHIFADQADFSDKQIRRSLQYYNHDIGIIDRHMPASQEMHANYKAPKGNERCEELSNSFAKAGESDGKKAQKVFEDLKDSMQPYIPKGMDAVDFFDRNYSYPWPYFSRFDGTGIKNGKPWDLESAQGDPEKMPRTWYVGGAVVFESVNDILSYNLRLLHRDSAWSKPFQEVQAAFHETTAHRWCREHQGVGRYRWKKCLTGPGPPLL